MEISCDDLRIEDGFEVLRACALHPRVRKARFANKLDGPDNGLYWQLRYLHEDGQERDETRHVILKIKEQALLDPALQCGSIHIYRAVLEDGIREIGQFRTWLERNPPSGLTNWKPKARVE